MQFGFTKAGIAPSLVLSFLGISIFLFYQEMTITSNTYQLPLTFEQILILVQQLPKEEQIKLKQEIDKGINAQEEDLLTVFDRIGKNAQEKGLTEDILQQLLADES